MSEVLAVTAAQLMSSPVVAIGADNSVAAAWEAMRQRHVHHLVVLDDWGLAAVIDDRTLSAQWPVGGPEAPHSKKVGDVVVHGVHCISPDAGVDAVARIMRDEHCDAVPVVTPAGILLGLVTARDIVAAVARRAVPVDAGSCEHEDRD